MQRLHGVEFVTTGEACAQLGPDITPALINSWVRRGLLAPVGRYGGRGHLFRWLDVVEAERRTRASGRGRPRKVKIVSYLPKVNSSATISEQIPQADAAQNPDAARHGSLVPPLDEPIVYYVSFANRIKIGHTRALRNRLLNLAYDELLVIEPGGRDLEQMRHKQFVEQHIKGEWFRLDETLRSHIEMLLDHYGPPENVLGWRP